MNRVIALLYGVVCHGLFLVAGAVMKLNMFYGMQLGLGPQGQWAPVWNGLLILQFVALHSWLMSKPGKRVLRALVPSQFGHTLDTTMFATIASIQVGLLFGLWSPLPLAAYTLPDPAWTASLVAFVTGSILLFVALCEGGLGIQVGYTGWTALWRGDRPRYPRTFASTGLHALIRHPIYLGFILVLWVGPIWSVDKLILAIPLSAYCLLGPRRKEARYAARYGEAYHAYLARTPSFIPRLDRLLSSPRESATHRRRQDAQS